jgi:hypothetical protein
LKYLLASMVGLAIGTVITVLTVISFHLLAMYSPLLSFIASTSNLDSNSTVWLLLMLHDSMVHLLFGLIGVCLLALLSKYWSILAAKYSAKLLTAFMIQLPITGYIILSSGMPTAFDSAYRIAMSIASFVGCISVLLLLLAVTLYQKRATALKI